jgi:enamine deaminase RidA (YjgF/YER057c/UK114 family)
MGSELKAGVRRAVTSDRFGWYDGLPASPAVRVGDLLFVSGQASVDADGTPVDAGDVRAQARRAFEALSEILELAGGSLDDVVDLMSFHTDLREIDAVFEVARDFLSGDYPAWTPIGSTGLQQPDLRISIRAIAHLGAEPKECYTPDTLRWWRSLPVSGGCKKGSLLFISGQMAADADGIVIAPGNGAGQARFAYNRIREIAELAGASLADVIDVCSFHQDARAMVACNEVHDREVFADLEAPFDDAPAWTAIGVPGLYKLGMLSSYRAIADLTPGPRVARTPASLWWKISPISGGTKKEGGVLIGLAGEVASDGDGQITTPGDTAAQARYAFNRLKETLEMFGASMANIVEVTSFHKDPRAWEIVMAEGKAYFGEEDGPAWTPVGVTGLFQEGYLHEIYALAVV